MKHPRPEDSLTSQTSSFWQDAKTHNPAAVSPPWNVKLWRYAFHLPFVDRTLRRRADDMYAKAKLDLHMKQDGCYVDVGSGSGHMVERVISSGSGVRCMGVDPFWRPILQVRRRLADTALDRHHFSRAGGQRLPFPDGSVDGVFFCFVLHHVPYELQSQLIQEARRVLKQDGVLCLFEDTPADPVQWRRVERWDRIQNLESPWEKHYYRSVKEWRGHHSKMAFEVIHEHEFDRMIPQMGMSPVPHCCTVLRKP